jgi:tRNA G10  N-methylase Trm11
MPTYSFTLGHQPHISTAEIEAVFSQQKIKYKIISSTKNNLLVETTDELNATELINRLGGTIKISERIEQNLTKLNEINNCIINFLIVSQPEGKIIYSISGIDAREAALQIKKELKSGGRSVRYVEAKNSATILHNKLVEKQGDFNIIDNSVFVTRALQPFEEFSERDYGRPGADSESGMLPPKLARILINLSQANLKQTILDPFCGSGTILMEALAMGFTNIIGSDISEKAITDTKQNLAWLSEKISIKSSLTISVSDVLALDKSIPKNSIDCIVTEPYLGKPLKGNESQETLEKQVTELKKLYTRAFQSFAKILKTKGVVIFIIPRFRWKNDWIVIPCLDEIKKAGFKHLPFSSTEPYLLYSRPGQHLGREIWKLVKE